MKRLVSAALIVVLATSACSGDGNQLADPVETVAPGAVASTVLDSMIGAGADSAATDAASTPVDELAVDPTPAPQVEVPETGIPGLDSDDLFCAAWSRFGGSWQVLSVGSSFLGDPDRVAVWEVASAAVIAQAYADLVDHFPDQLAAEADTVADGYFGVLYRRSSAAGAALLMAGADADVITRLSDAWLAALAARDPADPDLSFVVPADVRQIVDEAAVAVSAQRVEFHLDPSMVVGVETPLTDAYLETACPDQGTLTGQEIDGT